jgi:hypothetical protein
VPYLGPALAKMQLDQISESNATDVGSLSTRLTHLTLLRATGRANGLAPDSALAGHGVSSVLAATTPTSTLDMLRLAAAAGNAKAEAAAAAAAAAGGGGAAPAAHGREPPPAATTALELSAQERHELVVRRYLLEKLQEAVAARRQSAPAAARGTTRNPLGSTA